MTHTAVARLALSLFVSAGAILASSSLSVAQEPLFDEARFGSLVAIDKTDTNDEKGAFINGMVLFDPWDHDNTPGWRKLIRPRIHVGADISTAGETNQAYAGFSWTANLGERFFLEAGFGGSLNDGKREPDGGRGPFVGCHTLFHEYVAAGVNLDKNWRVIAMAEHSSHANLCGDTNNGLTRGGVMLGYKF